VTSPEREQELLEYLSERIRTKSDINEHLQLLYQMASETGVRNIVELGTRSGNSTCAFVIAASANDGKVVSVDNGVGEEFTKISVWDELAGCAAFINAKLELSDYWTLVINDDIEFAKEYSEEIDLLFIDTLHSYQQTKKELEVWGDKVVEGGFIVIHDTVSFPEQLKAIWEYIDEHPGSDYVEHKNCNGLGVIIKSTLTEHTHRSSKVQLLAAVNIWQDRADRLNEGIIDLRARMREQQLYELERATVMQDRINALASSISFKLTKSIAVPLERALPDGTSRGELRRLATESVRIIFDQGFVSFSNQARSKIKRKLESIR